MEIDWNTELNFFKTAKALKGPDGTSFDTVVSACGAMEKDLNQAESCALFTVLPQVEPSASVDISRIRTIRNRLFLLGYLEKDTKKADLDAELKAAVRQFQKEAGLTIDGWVGEQTWKALQELVGFETPTSVNDWMHNGEPMAAFRRALWLRLYTLGVTGQKPVSQTGSFENDLDRFWEIAAVLEFSSIRGKKKKFPDAAQLLFDPDAIVEELSHARIPQGREDRLKVHGFVLCAAKIELWLAGYDVRPDGPDFEVFEFYRQKPGQFLEKVREIRASAITEDLDLKPDTPVHRGIVKFLRDNGSKYGKALRNADSFLTFFPKFFSMISKGRRMEKDLSLEEKISMVQEVMEKQPSRIPRVWEVVRQIGARIWDGIKRVWGWLRGLVKRAVKIGRNMARLIYSLGLQSFSVVKKAIQAAADAVSYLISPVVPGSDPKVMAVGHEKDFDFLVFVNLSAPAKAVTTFSGTFRTTACVFAAMCRLLKIFINILMRVPKSLATGWAGLIWGLVGLLKDIEAFKGAIGEYKILVQEI